MQTLTVRKAEVAPLVAATFPDYKGRKFRVQIAETVRLDDLNWSGGSRSQYRATTLTGEPIGTADRFNAMAPWDCNQIEGVTLPITPGACVVRHSIFCGQDTGLTITIHPTDAPRLLSKGIRMCANTTSK